MAESPPRGGDHPGKGDGAIDASKRAGASVAPKGNSPSGAPKEGEPDPLFNQGGLKRRTTQMGLAPAPHLGGLMGSAGAKARAEAEARKRRVQARLSSRPPPAPARSLSESPHDVNQEELIEPLPAPFTGPAPALTPVGHSLPQTDAEAFEGATPTIFDGHVPPAEWAAPRYGSTTVVIAGNVLAAPQTPHVPLTLPLDNTATPGPQPPRQRPLEEVESTIVIEPPGGRRPGRPDRRSAPPPSNHPRPARHDEPPPNTERMLRSVVPTPSHAMVPYNPNNSPTAMPPMQAPPNASVAPQNALARSWESALARHTVPGQLDKRLVLLNDPDSSRAASFRVLRDSLLAKNLPRVLAVSSPGVSDGKTTCAINLALALAEQGNTQVLLIDGNFYEPELARIFQIDRLQSLTPADPVMAPYKISAITSSLHVAGIVMTEGEPQRQGRFEQNKFEVLLDRLCRAAYDYLIIDTPALHGSPAVAHLVGTADAALLAVRSGGTTGRDLRRATAQLPANKAMGVVLIDVIP